MDSRLKTRGTCLAVNCSQLRCAQGRQTGCDLQRSRRMKVQGLDTDSARVPCISQRETPRSWRTANLLFIVFLDFFCFHFFREGRSPRPGLPEITCVRPIAWWWCIFKLHHYQSHSLVDILNLAEYFARKFGGREGETHPRSHIRGGFYSPTFPRTGPSLWSEGRLVSL
jgi:hypothetical protein